jgi:hypothetical protein
MVGNYRVFYAYQYWISGVMRMVLERCLDVGSLLNNYPCGNSRNFIWVSGRGALHM